MGILTLAGVDVGSHPASLHLPPTLGLGKCYFCLVIVQGLRWLLSRRLSARSILPPVGSSPGCLPLPPMPTHAFSWAGEDGESTATSLSLILIRKLDVDSAFSFSSHLRLKGQRGPAIQAFPGLPPAPRETGTGVPGRGPCTRPTEPAPQSSREALTLHLEQIQDSEVTISSPRRLRDEQF